jgi:hypothetical protein
MPVSISEADALTACGCRTFAAALAAGGPYADLDALVNAAREIWWAQVRGTERAPPARAPPFAKHRPAPAPPLPPLPPPLSHLHTTTHAPTRTSNLDRRP